MGNAREHIGHKKRRGNRVRFVIAAVLLALSAVLMAAFSQFADVLFPAYRVFSKTALGMLSAVTSLAPFAVWDFALVALVLGFLVALFVCAVRRRGLVCWLSSLCIVVAAIAFASVSVWALNHYAPPLSEELDLAITEYSEDQLAAATSYYLERAAANAQAVPREDDHSLTSQDFYELAAIAGSGYSELAGEYSVFEGTATLVKALLAAGEPLLFSGHNGIFCPITGEAAVPLNCANEDEPFTMCHEAAHRLGIASEQEANFSAYLACEASADVRFVYSGDYRAFCYCYEALAAHNPTRAKELVASAIGEGIDPSNSKTYGARLVLNDWQNATAHYDAYEGPFENVGTVTNNTYLQLFGEESGVRSYGEVVDYLIAWSEHAAR